VPALVAPIGKPIVKRAGMRRDRAIAMNSEWKSVQFHFLTLHA
jgi:hypothetical protein